MVQNMLKMNLKGKNLSLCRQIIENMSPMYRVMQSQPTLVCRRRKSMVQVCPFAAHKSVIECVLLLQLYYLLIKLIS